jgi:hypothetical protein
VATKYYLSVDDAGASFRPHCRTPTSFRAPQTMAANGSGKATSAISGEFSQRVPQTARRQRKNEVGFTQVRKTNILKTCAWCRMLPHEPPNKEPLCRDPHIHVPTGNVIYYGG